MKLLVIVICLLCERFLMHAGSLQRFQWFNAYAQRVHNTKLRYPALSSPWVQLAFIVVPLLLGTAVILLVFHHLLFGFLYFFLNLVIFYYCLGPQNPFYPHALEEPVSEEKLGNYFAAVNGQLFAVIFWYIILGPLGALAYRLISLARTDASANESANVVTNLLDWAPSKMTALLYLLVGNFRIGFRHFTRLFFTPPHNNEMILSVCGLHAVGYEEREQINMPQAEILVEHSVIVLLVLLAFFTMVAWL